MVKVMVVAEVAGFVGFMGGSGSRMVAVIVSAIVDVSSNSRCQQQL